MLVVMSSLRMVLVVNIIRRKEEFTIILSDTVCMVERGANVERSS